jgi:hypothetical protein
MADQTLDAEQFARALMRLWPHGDAVVRGLRARIIGSARTVFAKYGCDNELVVCHDARWPRWLRARSCRRKFSQARKQ